MKPLWIRIGLTGMALLAACAPTPEPLPGDQAIEHWIGRPMTSVTSAWGPPAEERSLDGGMIYTYPATQYRSSSQAANLPPETATHAYRSEENLRCKGVFTVDAAGLVTAAEWQGYECWGMPR